MNIIGAQYEARFGLPSNMVLTSGSPNANVLCDAQNMAATVSPRLKPQKGCWNILNKNTNDMICRVGKMARRAAACLNSRPIPFEKALQKAFQTIPSKINSCSLLNFFEFPS